MLPTGVVVSDEPADKLGLMLELLDKLRAASIAFWDGPLDSWESLKLTNFTLTNLAGKGDGVGIPSFLFS